MITCRKKCAQKSTCCCTQEFNTLESLIVVDAVAVVGVVVVEDGAVDVVATGSTVEGM